MICGRVLDADATIMSFGREMALCRQVGDIDIELQTWKYFHDTLGIHQAFSFDDVMMGFH